MTSSGCSIRGTENVPGRRRIWSPREESILIAGLKEIIHEGWRCENGFRTGYLAMLEKFIRRHIPNTDLCAEPHIRNKMHVWKKNHGSIHTMLSRSGFSWSEKENMVIFAHQSIWDEYVKTDEHAKGMKNKSYPLYKDWCEVFGNDRATGENAEDLHAAEVNPVQPVGIHGVSDDLVDGLMDENDITSSGAASAKAYDSKGKKRKRTTASNESEKLLALVGQFVEETNTNFQSLASKIGFELKISEKREKVFAALGSLGVLSVDQQISAAKTLAKDTALLELFFSLPEDAQARMVMTMVSGP